MYDPGWSDEETISAFLACRPRRHGPHWVSSLGTVLRDSREATGRYVVSGELRSTQAQRSASWLGALGYMVMLDQIGECFRPADEDERPKKEPPFIRALVRFAGCTQDLECQALYALRCCFAHDYALVNVARPGWEELRSHHFVLTDDVGSGPAVILPPHRWDGDLRRRPLRTATRVSLPRFGDLAEGAYRRLCELHDARRLVIALAGGGAELRARYAATSLA